LTENAELPEEEIPKKYNTRTKIQKASQEPTRVQPKRRAMSPVPIESSEPNQITAEILLSNTPDQLAANKNFTKSTKTLTRRSRATRKNMEENP
jgi:hypothetical protein